jgi:hypothetical protein
MDNAETDIGYIDGSVDATTQRFEVVLHDHAVVQLDDLLVAEQELPAGRGALKHFVTLPRAVSRS